MVLHTLTVRARCVFAIIIITSVTSCAGLFKSVEEIDELKVAQSAELSTEEIEQYIEEWEDTKSKVDRLVKIEDDLALIMQEVGKSSKLKNLPPEYIDKMVTDYIEAENDGVDLDGTQSPEGSLNSSAKRQYYAAHLGLFLRKDSAKAGWDVLVHRYPKIFNQLTPLVKEIQRSNQVIYSLRVGPFDDLKTSNSVCNILAQYKYRCETTEFSGEAI